MKAWVFVVLLGMHIGPALGADATDAPRSVWKPVAVAGGLWVVNKQTGAVLYCPQPQQAVINFSRGLVCTAAVRQEAPPKAP